MMLIDVKPENLALSPELSRSGSAKQFEEHLQASIDEIGLVEPIKIAKKPRGGYLVIDGTMRLRAVRAIRAKDVTRFKTMPAYVLDYDKRYEIRYQSDIYQDLLPSQLATLVEHLHEAEKVAKVDIARFIGVSPATLRNYTGLSRLLERGGLPARVVELMDVNVIPSSNPFAWLRLTDEGFRKVLTEEFAKGKDPDEWITESVKAAKLGGTTRYPLKYIEMVTEALPADCFRTGADERAVKKVLGTRRAVAQQVPKLEIDFSEAYRNLARVSARSGSPVLRSVAASMQEYLK